MAGGIFLNAGIIADVQKDEIRKYNIQQTKVEFYFPDGFTQLKLIEECRALNALDVSDPDNFDLMYDITMQMLVGKVCFIYFIDEEEKRHELTRFVITDRYMNLRGVDAIDEDPVLVNWLVEFVAGYLGKKYPRSLKDFRTTMSERNERMKNSPTNQSQNQQ